MKKHKGLFHRTVICPLSNTTASMAPAPLQSSGAVPKPIPPERLSVQAGGCSPITNGRQPSHASYDGQLSQRKFVLIIDDSLTVRKIVETCLRREGIEVKGFADGVEVLNWLLSPEVRIPHLVLLDIELPKMDGYEVARRLKARSPFEETVIIMLSRRDGLLDKLRGRLAGASDHLAKPFQERSLVQLVKQYLALPEEE